ncbi:MAG: RelA/SpoT family protein [Gammaproteobacteria bacterium]
MQENPAIVAELIGAARKATPELRALAEGTARALVPLALGAQWEATAAAVPLLAAGVIGERAAHEQLGAERYRLAAHAAALPSPRLAAREAFEGEDPAQAERLRRLFLALIRDLRIVPLMLAGVLARLETLKDAPAGIREAAAREVFLLHAPLANRLGIWQLKWPLEDAALRFSEPARYAEIAHGLAERRGAREARLATARGELETALGKAAITAQVSGRPKHIYSIQRKMQAKDIALEDLYDLMGLRVIVADVTACYAALGVVHERWRYLPHEFDDYIAAPKGNFYRSLHTAVLDDDGRALEIQIRTEAMHREAELGVAAHWRYKEGGARDPALEERLAWLRQLLASSEHAEGGGSFVEAVTSELASARIYALTPQGRVVDLPAGATPLDFAYAVHSGLGHRTTGARINGKLVALTSQLATGDTVQILTRTTARPSRDWLRPEAGYLASRRARQKVRAWFRAADKTRETTPKADKGTPSTVPPLRRPSRPASKVRAVVSAMPELPVELALCCAPKPGQAIAAFVTRGRGIRLHRQDCASFLRNATRAPRQTLDAHWE